MNKQQLASKIWESANKMRSKIEANEYKDYILGFIFYKFLSDKQVKFLKEHDWTDEYLPDVTEDDAETMEFVRSNIGYFISYENLFSTWIAQGNDFTAANVTDALSAFSRLINTSHKKVFDKIFATLETMTPFEWYREWRRYLTRFSPRWKPGFPNWANLPAPALKPFATCCSLSKISPWMASRTTMCSAHSARQFGSANAARVLTAPGK